jgi:hypothetical protein
MTTGSMTGATRNRANTRDRRKRSIRSIKNRKSIRIKAKERAGRRTDLAGE